MSLKLTTSAVCVIPIDVVAVVRVPSVIGNVSPVDFPSFGVVWVGVVWVGVVWVDVVWIEVVWIGVVWLEVVWVEVVWVGDSVCGVNVVVLD